jgi:hypothetical protein
MQILVLRMSKREMGAPFFSGVLRLPPDCPLLAASRPVMSQLASLALRAGDRAVICSALSLASLPMPPLQEEVSLFKLLLPSMLHPLSFAHRWREIDALWCVAHAQCGEQTGDECDTKHDQRPDEVRLDRHGKQDGQ